MRRRDFANHIGGAKNPGILRLIGARGYTDQFFADIEEPVPSRAVSHCEQMAESLLAEEPALLLVYDIASESGGGARGRGRNKVWGGWGDGGEMPGF